jgi:hypothetical protein
MPRGRLGAGLGGFRAAGRGVRCGWDVRSGRVLGRGREGCRGRRGGAAGWFRDGRAVSGDGRGDGRDLLGPVRRVAAGKLSGTTRRRVWWARQRDGPCSGASLPTSVATRGLLPCRQRPCTAKATKVKLPPRRPYGRDRHDHRNCTLLPRRSRADATPP